uniref:Ribosomal protein S4 n=1 Tax=Cyanophora sudae TaxID=1522369 RepID=A0A873WRQ4_9EUKA|nr:ribosomal protein S4 [Cyanophora sudae]QPB15045.1 ribosomal protein S4 [Cyanophora sudae]
MQKYKIHQKFKQGNFWLNNTEFLIFKEKIKWKLKKRKKKLHRSRNIWFNLKLYTKKIFKNYYPNMTKMQFKKYIGMSNSHYLKGVKTKENYIKLYHILERRLDIVLVRTNLVKTPNAARQLISHKNVFVDNELVTTPGYLLSNGQVICIKRINTQFLKIKTNIKTNEYIFKTFDSALKKKLLSNTYKNFILNAPIYKVRLPSYIKAINLTNLKYNYYIFLFNTPRWIEIPYPTNMWIPSICQRKRINNNFIHKKIKIKNQKYKFNQLFKLKIKKKRKLIVLKTKLKNLKSKKNLSINFLKKKINIPINSNNNLYKKNYRMFPLLKYENNFSNNSIFIKKKKFFEFVNSFDLRKVIKADVYENNNELKLQKNIELKKQSKNLLFKKKTKLKKTRLKFNKKCKKEKIKVFSNLFFNNLIWFYKKSKKHSYIKKQ